MEIGIYIYTYEDVADRPAILVVLEQHVVDPEVAVIDHVELAGLAHRRLDALLVHPLRYTSDLFRVSVCMYKHRERSEIISL